MQEVGVRQGRVAHIGLGQAEGAPAGLARDRDPHGLNEWKKVCQAVAPDLAKLLPGQRIQAERLDGGSADHGAPFDPEPIGAPSEVLLPGVPPRVKEDDPVSGLRIPGFRPAPFLLVATGAGQGEV